MKALSLIALLIVALLIPAASQAASPEDSYLAARDRAIKMLAESRKRGTSDQQITVQQTRALADLETQLRRVVGTSALKGFSQPGRINLEGLLEGDQDFGMLDGLIYTSSDKKTRIVVTTQDLLKAWLRVHRSSNGETIPEGIAPALRFAPFYTQALGGGAAVGGFAELPIWPESGFATALLVARAQDIGPRNPRELIVALVRGQRVFIVSTETDVAIAPMPKCEAIWPELKKKSDTAYEAYRASDMKDKSILDRLHKTEDESDDAYRRCFAEGALRDPNFMRLTAQAKAIVDSLPAK